MWLGCSPDQAVLPHRRQPSIAPGRGGAEAPVKGVQYSRGQQAMHPARWESPLNQPDSQPRNSLIDGGRLEPASRHPELGVLLSSLLFNTYV